MKRTSEPTETKELEGLQPLPGWLQLLQDCHYRSSHQSVESVDSLSLNGIECAKNCFEKYRTLVLCALLPQHCGEVLQPVVSNRRAQRQLTCRCAAAYLRCCVVARAAAWSRAKCAAFTRAYKARGLSKLYSRTGAIASISLPPCPDA